MTPEDGLVVAFLLDGKGGGTRLDWAGLRAWTPEQGALWVHLDFTHERAVHWLEQESGLDPLVTEALTADETRPRCIAVEEGLLISLRGVNSNPGADPEDMVAIRLFCTAERIVSTRRRRLLTASDLADALDRGKGAKTTGALTSMLADQLTERMRDVLAELDDRIDDLEERIIEGAGQEMRAGVLDLRREIIQLRRYLAPQRDALARLYQERPPWMGKHDRLQVLETSDQVTRYIEDLDSARDRANVSYEELASRVGEQMNSRMYVLSMIAGLFLPLGFLTGLLGINVGGIPLADSPRGFAEVVALMVVLLIVQILVFRRKKWF